MFFFETQCITAIDTENQTKSTNGNNITTEKSTAYFFCDQVKLELCFLLLLLNQQRTDDLIH